MKLWLIVFLLLPLAGMFYASWRLWWLLPTSAVWKVAAVALLLSGFLGMVFYLRSGVDSFSRPTAIALYEVLTSWPIVLLYLVLTFLLLDFGRLCGIVPRGWLFNSVKGTAGIALFLVALLTYGHWNYLRKVRQPMEIATKKQLQQPLKIVMLSDLHLGYHNRRAEFSRWVNLINAENPDLILIGGDIVDISVRPLTDENMAEEWHRLTAPVYACLGNHEYYANSFAARQFYKDAGIQLLIDSVVTVKGIQIVGRDDRTNSRRLPLKNLMAHCNPQAFTILLDHQPYHLEEAEQCGVDFQLSGHTHYGQVWPISWIEDLMYEKAFGTHRRGNTDYYVSSGMGIWGGKFRIGTRSEYIVLTVNNAE